MRILMACDEAFSFTYRANVDALARIGSLSCFSPLRDKLLPACDLLYLPGGYPELYARELSANATLRHSVAEYARNGGRVLAECGGFIYLCDKLDERPLAGVLPLVATMKEAKLHLGYRQLPLGETALKGHEFHYSSLLPCRLPATVTEVQGQKDALGTPVDTSLYLYLNVVAGYTHWYWADKDFEETWKLIQTNCTR